MAGFSDRDRIQRVWPGVSVRVIDEATYAVKDARLNDDPTVTAGQIAVRDIVRQAGSDTNNAWYQTTAALVNSTFP